MNFERDDKQSVFTTFFSTIGLAIALFAFYSFKGEPGDEDSLYRLSNLKSMVETGNLRHPYDPLSSFSFYFFYKILGLKSNTYQFVLAFVLSSFLHSLMLCLREKKWKLNNYLITYLVGFLPFTSYLPYYYYEEVLCFSFILLLHYKFRLDNLQDLLKLIILTLLSFLAHLPGFLFGYLIFVLMNSYKYMQEKKSTVFFKKKNIPLRMLLIYSGVFVTIVIFMTIGDFYGSKTFSYLMNEYWEVIYKFLPIIGIMGISEYLLRSEKELNTLGTTFFVLALIALGIYLTYKTEFKGSETLEFRKAEIVKLKEKSKILVGGSSVYTSREFSDYIYLKTSEDLKYNNYAEAKSGDYINISEITNEDLAYFDKKSIGYRSYYIIDKNNVLLNKNIADIIVKESKKNQTIEKVKKYIQIYNKNSTPSESYNRAMNKLFGF
ncbi:MAG: hypothetical protein KDK36_05005 [Leptospiraceae bacterium]|nr:hypothetical protein [Leptospiraceae bacterium]